MRSMRRKRWLTSAGILTAAGVFGACVASGGSAETGECRASASLKSPDGSDLGRVEVIEAPRGALIQARLQGLPEGTHAIHLHEKGACSPDFGASGGHFNPTGAKHGYLSAEGFHQGDLPNFWVPSGGTAELDVFVPGLHVCGGEAPLLDSDGTAVIIHHGADDYRTDPAGAAGDRIACGPLSK